MATDWLRAHQVASGPVGKKVGQEKPPNVKGWMYRSEHETSTGRMFESGTLLAERGIFDFKMSMFRENRGPPPQPVCGGVVGIPEVAAYESWYYRVGKNLAEKWEREHPPRNTSTKPLTPKKDISPSPTKKDAPSRVTVEISENSGW